MCLAQGHKTVTPVRLEPAVPRSRVKHSTTELPMVFLNVLVKNIKKYFLIIYQWFTAQFFFKKKIGVFRYCDCKIPSSNP